MKIVQIQLKFKVALSQNFLASLGIRRKAVQKNFAKLTGKYLCRTAFLNKVTSL